MHRFYADQARSSGHSAYLTCEDAHHALKVLRLGTGSTVELIDGGNRYNATISSITNGDVMLQKFEMLQSTETSVTFTLFQGIPKGDKMDLIVQKAVELGVSQIVPVMMSRCIVRLDQKDTSRKRERWQKIARESGKQCGRCIIPDVSFPVRLNEITDMQNSPEEIVVPWEMKNNYGPLSFFKDHPHLRSLGIVIGPEGGISDEEIAFLYGIQAKPITLGPRILRTETAGLAAVSALSALYGEME